VLAPNCTQACDAVQGMHAMNSAEAVQAAPSVDHAFQRDAGCTYAIVVDDLVASALHQASLSERATASPTPGRRSVRRAARVTRRPMQALPRKALLR
jgi:hypothetical protein